MCCFDKSFNPVSCPRQSFECNFNDPIALPAIEFDATKRIKTTPKPWAHSSTPRPIQINHGFKCEDSKRSNNHQAIRRDFDYFALSMNWPETACRFLMTKGKTCSIPGIDLMKFGDSDVGDIVMLTT